MTRRSTSTFILGTVHSYYVYAHLLSSLTSLPSSTHITWILSTYYPPPFFIPLILPPSLSNYSLSIPHFDHIINCSLIYHHRSTGIALDAASSLCSSGRIYDISSRSSRSREMSRKSSTASTWSKHDIKWISCLWRIFFHCLSFTTGNFILSPFLLISSSYFWLLILTFLLSSTSCPVLSYLLFLFFIFSSTPCPVLSCHISCSFSLFFPQHPVPLSLFVIVPSFSSRYHADE